MRFLVPDRGRLAPSAIDRAYFAGIDDLPWQSRTQWTDEGLTVRRSEDDSGTFHIPWRAGSHGELMLTTATLMERDGVYHLSLELARGTLNRFRNHLFSWQALGLVVSEETRTLLRQALEQMSLAATRQSDPLACDKFAQQAIEICLSAADSLGREYADQSVALRRKAQANRPATLCGVNLGTAPLADNVLRTLGDMVNSVVVPLSWREVERQEGVRDWSLTDRQLEWCRSKSLKVCGGPLLQLDRCATPDWLYLWEGDDDNLVKFVAEYISTAVARYRGKVHLWQCAARLNVEEVFSMSEEQRLRMAALAIEITRQVDPRAPIVLQIDQPWSEFMSHSECDLSPLHFADALVRADLGLSGIGLEINLGYAPGGSAPRDMLEFSRQLDRWSMLGLPLLVFLTLPSAGGADALARSAAVPVDYAATGAPTPESQRAWIEKLMPIMAAKQPVQGIFWNQASDAVPHDYAHGGLFDAANKPKPAVEALRAMRQQYLI